MSVATVVNKSRARLRYVSGEIHRTDASEYGTAIGNSGAISTAFVSVVAATAAEQVTCFAGPWTM